jgi:hypothetical protein
MEKVIWVKTGWSEYYQGGPVNGNFDYLTENSKRSDTDVKREGHEAFNFLPFPNGSYGIYLPPQAGGSIPNHEDAGGWTVICLSKKPKQKGVHVVGWLEDASLLGDLIDRPEYASGSSFRLTRERDEFTYCISADTAYIVPPEDRNRPFSHTSIRQGKYSFLSGPDVKAEQNKSEVLKILLNELKLLKKVAVRNPNPLSIHDRDNDEIDPFSGFGTADHRQRVEKAAVDFVARHYRKNGYDVQSHENLNCGYDLYAANTEADKILEIEVKGTASAEEGFFLTRNEYYYMNSGTRDWRLALVTDAISNPVLHVYTAKQVNKRFDMESLAWKCTVKP